jgi:hypothetical protein
MPAGSIELTPQLTGALPSGARGSGLTPGMKDLGLSQCHVKLAGAPT